MTPLASVSHPFSCSDIEYEGLKPLKRSRSDQSLSATAQAGAVTHAGSAGGASSSTQPLQYRGGLPPLFYSQGDAGSSYSAGSSSSSSTAYVPLFARAQSVPSLPVVLSDEGSSINSLLSLDSS